MPEQTTNETEPDKVLASLALFSLTYITRSTLENEAAAQVFYLHWIKNNKLNFDVDVDDIPDLIALAKKGEDWLERALTS